MELAASLLVSLKARYRVKKEGSKHTLSAVEVRKTENIGGTALGTAIQTRARDVGLALVDAAGRSEGGSGEEEGSQQLHGDCNAGDGCAT